MEYCSFIRAFDRLIESKTYVSSDRLCYLEQLTPGDVKKIVRPCHYLPYMRKFTIKHAGSSKKNLVTKPALRLHMRKGP